MALLSIGWAIRLVEDPEHPFPAWGKMLALVLSMRPIMGDLSHGNVNLFILFLVMAALFAFQYGRWQEPRFGSLGRRLGDSTAGVLLGLAIACKVTPALFVPYFLWKRAWTTLAGCLCGLVLFLWLVPGLILGMKDNERYLTSWVERMILPYVQGAQVWSEHNNQSLPGLFHRMGTHRPSFSRYENDVYTPVEYHNMMELSPTTVQWLLKGCMILFAGLVIWRCRTSLQTPDRWRLAAEFSIVMLGMLLFSERTWKHHCVTLLLPFTVIAYYLSARPMSPNRKAYLVGTLIAVVLLMLMTSTGLFDRHDRFGKMAQVYGAYVWAFLLLAAALFVIVGKKEASPAGGAGEWSNASAK
jgi:hypothetical protein